MKIRLPYCSCNNVIHPHMEAWFERLLIGRREIDDQQRLDLLIEQSGLHRPSCSPIHEMGVVHYLAAISLYELNEARRMVWLLNAWFPQAMVSSSALGGCLLLNGRMYPDAEWQRARALDLEVLRLFNSGAHSPVYRLGVAEVDQLVRSFLEQL